MVTKTEEGKEFPAAAYAYAPDPKSPSTWKLRLWETPDSKVTAAQVGRAAAAIGKGFRGQQAQIPAAARPTVVAKIRAAWEKTHPGAKQDDMPVALREAVAQDFQQIIELACDALDSALGTDSTSPSYNPAADWWELEAIFTDRVVIEQEGRCYSYPYTIDANNQVQLGARTEVVESYTPVREAARALEGGGAFLEAVDAEGTVWDATLIRSGLSLNNNFYPDAVLREAAPLFEGKPVFAKPDAMHIKGEGKDVNRLAGWISNPLFVEGNTGIDTGRLVARLNLSSATNLRAVLADAWKRGKRDLAGLSIDADGTAKTELREAKKVRVAKSITKVNSVDLIVEPGAGGALVHMIEAANANPEQEQEMKLRERMLETIKTKKPAVFATINVETVTDEALEAHYREALTPAPADDTQAGPQLTRKEFEEKMRMVEAKAAMRVTLATSKLPLAAREKLEADFNSRTTFVEADVTNAIKAEREYLAKFTESGKVVINGEGDIQVEDRSKKMADMLDAFFDAKHKDHRKVQSFKECYIEITGDRRVTGRLEDADKTRMAEAVGEAFRESLDETSFSNVLGSSITRRMVADYVAAVDYDQWRQIVSVVPVQDFRTQNRVRFGGYGNLPIVASGDAYQGLASPTDEQATYGVQKRGGTEDITMEMIKNDDVGAIRRIPMKLARAAKRTLSQFVFDFIRTNPVIYDGLTLFHASHGNLGSTAISAAELALARAAMLKQAELNSADRLGIGPKFILVPPDIQDSAWNLFQRGTNLDKTFIQDLNLTILMVWYWTDTNDWALCADPNDIPTIEIGFLDGQQEPELFVQDMPNVGSMFSNDRLTYKIRHIYGGNVVDYRGLYKEVV